MTSHEFANQLLQGPDLPICTPLVKEYEEGEVDGEDGVALSTPKVSIQEVNFGDGLSLILSAQMN